MPTPYARPIKFELLEVVHTGEPSVQLRLRTIGLCVQISHSTSLSLPSSSLNKKLSFTLMAENSNSTEERSSPTFLEKTVADEFCA